MITCSQGKPQQPPQDLRAEEKEPGQRQAGGPRPQRDIRVVVPVALAGVVSGSDQGAQLAGRPLDRRGVTVAHRGARLRWWCSCRVPRICRGVAAGNVVAERCQHQPREREQAQAPARVSVKVMGICVENTDGA